MKLILILGIGLAVLLVGCVQKTYTKTVVYILRLTGPQKAVNVEIRGNDKPLTWESDLRLTQQPDSTYRAVVTYQTGYRFTEVKFVVNGVFELANQPNRRVTFAETDSTYYNATFDRLDSAGASH